MGRIRELTGKYYGWVSAGWTINVIVVVRTARSSPNHRCLVCHDGFLSFFAQPLLCM